MSPNPHGEDTDAYVYTLHRSTRLHVHVGLAQARLNYHVHLSNIELTFSSGSAEVQSFY